MTLTNLRKGWARLGRTLKRYVNGRLPGALLIVAMLAGCDQGDGYQFQTKEFTRREVTIMVVEYPSLKDLKAEAVKRGQPEDVMAFATYSLNHNTCTVHIVDPAVRYYPEYIGHEFVHCIHGRWHG